MTNVKKIPRLKKSVDMRPFKNGLLVTHTSYMWVEKTLKEADARSGTAYYNKFASCCICRWQGAYMHEAIIDKTLFYIPVCRKCENFMWGTHGNNPYARIYSTAFETKRRKF